MPFTIIDGQGLFFAHVPKAAGTSIEDYLEARFGRLSMLDREWFGIGKGHDGVLQRSVRTSPQHISAADAEMFLPPPPFPIHRFAFVRDPTARIVSEFKYQRRYGHLKNRTIPPSFTLWFSAMIAAARREPTVCDNHIRPQVDFVSEQTRVFHLEDGFSDFVAWLNDVTDTTAPPEITIGSALSSGEQVVELTDRDCEMISAYYEEDFREFGYNPPEANRRGSALIDTARMLTGKLVGHGIVAMRRRKGWP